MIEKVVIPAAGLGTRLFPATKEQPKEMLPIFSRLIGEEVSTKPLIQLVFEQLYDVGLREFCFVVGKGKRVIEDYFTQDLDSVVMLRERGRSTQALDLERFYQRLRSSTIFWVNQPKAKGFGDAVLMAKPFVQNAPCLVHAGDTYIISKNTEHLRFLMKVYERLSADIAFFVKETADPRQYGVIKIRSIIEKRIYRVEAAIEKPEKPPTNLTIVPIYIFRPVIFDALEKTTPGKGGEIQLTDGIQKLIERGLNVFAVKLRSNDVVLDIGSPQTYWKALSLSHQHFCRSTKNDKPASEV